jgi:hypothetical protein
MVGLVELRAEGNRLGAPPAAIGALRELRHLDLRGTLLTALPEAAAASPRLAELDVRWAAALAPPPWFAALEARGCLVYA